MAHAIAADDDPASTPVLAFIAEPTRKGVLGRIFCVLYLALGMIARVLFVRIYTIRGETDRLISIRKANKREQRTWLR